MQLIKKSKSFQKNTKYFEMHTYTFNLHEAVINESISQDWDFAIQEWEIVGTYEDHGSTCTCGKKNISEVNIIKNKFTGATLKVGSQCVKQFMNVDMFVIHANVRKIAKDITKSVNRPTLWFFYQQGVITGQEFLDYVEIFRRRTLFLHQSNFKIAINQKILDFQQQTKKEATNAIS